MKNAFYVFVLPVALIVSFMLFPNNPPDPAWETKTDTRPPISLTVTPVEFGRNANPWRFTIVFDAHSGSLDDDPLQMATLMDNRGNIYQPTAWEGPGPGGHHREGVLVFDAIRPTPTYAKLNIKNVGGIAVRTFRWNLK